MESPDCSSISEDEDLDVKEGGSASPVGDGKGKAKEEETEKALEKEGDNDARGEMVRSLERDKRIEKKTLHLGEKRTIN